MKVIIIGASGFIGQALTAEALQRGHQVSAIVRDMGKLATLAEQAKGALQVIGLDVLNTPALATAIAEHEVVISAFSGHSATDVVGYYQAGIHSIVQAAKQANRRLLVVGGAASLRLPDGRLLLDSPDFPEMYRASALGAKAALAQLQQATDLHWSYLSPAAEIFPGVKTGQYRLGGDDLLLDAAGHSRISTGDYADAMLNEAILAQHPQQRFSIAY